MFNIEGNVQIKVGIREAKPQDIAALEDMYRALSRESLYYRYLRQCEAPLEECQEICELNQGDDGFSLIATDNNDRIIGVAHYIRLDDGFAEPAIIIADDYKFQGIGTVLFNQLCDSAYTREVSGFEATIHASNHVMMQLIKKSNYQSRTIYADGQLHCRITLNSQG